MLEDKLKTLFALEAEADPPPSHISVPAAGRSARVRQRLQRTDRGRAGGDRRGDEHALRERRVEIIGAAGRIEHAECRVAGFCQLGRGCFPEAPCRH